MKMMQAPYLRAILRALLYSIITLMCRCHEHALEARRGGVRERNAQPHGRCTVPGMTCPFLAVREQHATVDLAAHLLKPLTPRSGVTTRSASSMISGSPRSP
jgi:hypothetical protein